MRYHYEEAQKYVTFNKEDKNLRPITLSLPDPPPYKTIDGYGKNPIDQYFIPLKPSDKLNLAVEKAEGIVREWASHANDRKVTEYRVQEEFWKLLDENKDYYVKEIEFIKHIHWYLYYGYWFFNKGVPTWLPPTFFRYLNFWNNPKYPNGKPKYRDVDRRTYLFKWYCRTTHETLGNLNEKGVAIPDNDGNYVIITKPYRTMYGHIKAKRRREGATNQECNDIAWTVERNIKGDCVIMADKGDSAKGLFKDIMLTGWLNMPLWIKPINKASQGSTKIELTAPDTEYKVKDLKGVITYIETASEGGVDRMQLSNILSDESAKLLRSDARRRHNVSKLTTSQGNEIHGYMAYPSTVEEMNEGGEEYRALWNLSNFYIRNAAGQTDSGLGRIFWPAWDGYDHYIDRWGYSVINNPTEDQIKYAPSDAHYLNGIGAKELINNTINKFLTDNTPDSLREYREYIRKHPCESDHCWIGTSGDMGWDTIKVDRQLAEINRRNDNLVRGNFEWIDNIKFNPKGVRFIEDSIAGRFYVSDLFEGRCNKWTWTPFPTVWDEKKKKYVKARKPLTDFVTVAGADSFGYGTSVASKRRHTRSSDGGFHVMLNYNELIDADKPPSEWDTYHTICSYRYRPPSLDEYCEDVSKAIIYYGSNLSIERNLRDVWQYLVDNGIGGYLVHMQNADGSVNPQPGIHTGQGLGNKDIGFNLIGDYITYHLHKEYHPLVLQEMKDLKGPEDLTNKDCLAAMMCTLIGARFGFRGYRRRINSSSTIELKGTVFAPNSIK